MLASFACHLTVATKGTLDIASMGHLKTSTAKELKNSSVQIQGESSPSTKLANYSEMHTSELQKAR